MVTKAKLILLMNKILLGTTQELVAVANLFNSKTQREVKQNIPLRRDHWIEIK